MNINHRVYLASSSRTITVVDISGELLKISLQSSGGKMGGSANAGYCPQRDRRKGVSNSPPPPKKKIKVMLLLVPLQDYVGIQGLSFLLILTPG